MLGRIIAAITLFWALGFIWFAMALPQPAGEEKTDGVSVLTGGKGRIDRGLEAVRSGWSPRMFVSGVDPEVKPHEFADEYHIGSLQMTCCVTLGFAATDTTSNASEAAAWIRAQKLHSVRLVTSDWHMRRAVAELKRASPKGVEIVPDAVRTNPSFKMLFLEYHKMLARQAVRPLRWLR